MTTRRELLIALGALAASLIANAQQPDKVYRIGFLALTSGPDVADLAFRDQLRTLGYVEGRNLTIEFRRADGNEARLHEMAAELVRLKVDVIVTRSTFVAIAAKRATSTIPVVMANSADPIAAGVVASLAHPGGNVTGISQISPAISGKRLQLLHEIVPKSTRFAVLVWKDSPTRAFFVREVREAARQMGIALVVREINKPEEIAPAFGAMKRERTQALIVQVTPFTTNNRKQIAELAMQQRLPSMFEIRDAVDSGGLISYGAKLTEMFRRAAFYVDRILKGAKPADLPVEQPTKFELVVNMKTAKAMGLTIPQSVLLQADEVIE
jgi:putative ABC transport system substrate-binding protein